MKRALFTFLVLIVGAGLGGGGLYVANHWDQLSPFVKKDETKQSLERFRDELRKACATDPKWKGAVIKSVDVAGGNLSVRGVVASKEQADLITAKGKALLDESEELRQQCASGFGADLKILPLHEQLANLQRDFDEGRGAEKDEDALKRQVMRTTRLDGLNVTEDGKLVFTGVCIHGNSKPGATKDILRDAVSARLDALGILTHLPDITLDMRLFAPPAVTVQNQLAQNPAAKDVHVTAAWYDGTGKLHVAGLVGEESERKLIENALTAFEKDAQTSAIVRAPNGSPGFTLEVSTFAADKRFKELQKKLVEYARAENKPYLRRVRLDGILPTPLEDDKKKIRIDEEGNILYFFRVAGRLYKTADEQATIEKELQAWLIKELPRVPNSDQKPIAPKFAFDVKPSPIFALQDRIVQRRLDGAVFTDALFDEQGELELLGRMHRLDEKSRTAVEAAVKEVLGKEPANVQNMKAHESTKAQPIAWQDAVQACQANLAQSGALGQRLRLDRLYFAYETEQLRLMGDGVFLVDAPQENPDGALRKAIDDAIATRGQAYVKTTGVKHVRNPLVELQSLAGQRSDLDGVLFTDVRYTAEGNLHLGGFVGEAGHKAALTPIVAGRIEQSAELVKPGSDAQKSPGWSLDGLKPHRSAKGDVKWSEVMRACQADLASAPQPFYRRACMGRAYFQYAEIKQSAKDARSRRLVLQCAAVFLSKPQDGADDAALKSKIEQKLTGVSKQLLADVSIDDVQAELRSFPTPIFELQKQAVEKTYDGVLFADAFYDQTGKLTFTGMHANADQLKQIRAQIDQLLADKQKKAIAPAGLAPLDDFKLVAWQPMLDDVKGQFAQDKGTLFKQTRLDRAFFQYDKNAKAVVHFKGISIYQGKVITPEDQQKSMADRLAKRLPAKGLDGFDVDVAAITRVANPVYDMQTKARDRKLDGVVFSEIGFDAKGQCYVKLPFAPKDQADNIRKLIQEASDNHPLLRGIREQ